ncbi:MAG: universal stress protein [Casimicrobiaceae bacterium]|nr:universal stress protein [Casimicrobiaceae bacterium]MDW8311835.1 universal stress protein [Burkholderiales bacterium]
MTTSYRRFLVTVGGGAADPAVLATALSLARQFEAALTAIHVREAMHAHAMLSPEAAGIAMAQIRELEEELVERAKARVQEAAQALGREIALWVKSGDFASEVARAALTADLVITGQHNPDTGSQRTLVGQERLVLASSAPIYFVPFVARAEPSSVRPWRRVLVAWQSTREAALALRCALPLLQNASEVEVVQIGSPESGLEAALTEVARYLEAHRVAARTRVIPHRGRSALRWLAGDPVDASAGELLLSHAAEIDADGLVMGGYSHPRIWEVALGGVTQTVLGSMTLPVLMMH